MAADLLAPKYLGWLIEGFGVTLALSALASAAATALGLALCLARVARSPLWSWPARTWLSMFRNTPLLVQLFFWYFGASALMPEGLLTWLNTPHHWHLAFFGVAWPPFEYLAGFLGLTLYTSAFIAEEFRSGVQGVPRSQITAAQALGLTRLQVWLYIVMPQAFRIALPPLLGQYMNAVKNSSLTMAIGLAELSYASRQVETETFKTFQAFGVATLLYIGTIAAIELAGQWVQRRRPAPGAGS
ncbi:amino acid ABC transporter permease [Thauera sinica]|uniref:Amino acid ABC transporter permease n=1 Tax=Thauera sinica TaxID=2665146 RepID=A0ABW1APM0_9RHOO|nr:amino acid ABC transporter permease [Thauera sp. K11]ATE59498.1 amino acid ABC transporter permease [Thauera sp. K11]